MSEAGQATVVQSRDWARAGFSLVFLILVGAVLAVFTALAVIQIVWLLVQRAPNPSLQRVGQPFAQWLGDAARYLLMESEERPFPWAPWPAQKA